MAEKWEKLSEETVYSGYRKITRKKFKMPDESTSDFDIVDTKDFACILPLTSSNEVILTRQFRPGTEEVIEEPPSGYIEEGEDPLETARRELLEETGYTGDIVFLRTHVVSAYSTERAYFYLATSCRKVQEPKLDSTEYIEIIKMPLEEFRKSLRSKGRHALAGYLALDYLNLL